jgi:hypothetical protein
VHQAVIGALGARFLLCLGVTAGAWVRDRLGAHEQIDEFCETYDTRHWRSTAYCNAQGCVAITVGHPSRAD